MTIEREAGPPFVPRWITTILRFIVTIITLVACVVALLFINCVHRDSARAHTLEHLATSLEHHTGGAWVAIPERLQNEFVAENCAFKSTQKGRFLHFECQHSIRFSVESNCDYNDLDLLGSCACPEPRVENVHRWIFEGRPRAN